MFAQFISINVLADCAIWGTQKDGNVMVCLLCEVYFEQINRSGVPLAR